MHFGAAPRGRDATPGGGTHSVARGPRSRTSGAAGATSAPFPISCGVARRSACGSARPVGRSRHQVHRRRALRRALDVERVARLRTLCLRFVRQRAVLAKRMRAVRV